MLPYVDKPFALFGHSFGGLVSFELARELRRAYGLEPEQLFVSGCAAARVFCGALCAHKLSGPDFLREMKRLSEIPAQVLEDDELMRIVASILRADFAISDSYAYREESPLDCPITVYGGLSDFFVTREHLDGWRKETSASFSLRLFEGDHFFLHSSEKAVLAELGGSLARLANSID